MRIGGIALCSTAVAILALKLSTGSPLTRPHVPRRAIEVKVAQRIPMLRLPLSFAIAALGGVALWWPKSPRRRIGLAMLAMWALSVPVGYFIYDVTSHHLPLYRVADFALALPVLAAALGVGLIRLGWRHMRIAGAVLGALVVVGAVVIQLSVSRDAWKASPALLQPSRVQQVATAAAYLEAVHAERPVIFVTELPAYAPTSLLVRAGMPGDLVPYVRTFVGRSDDLLAGRKTNFPNEKLRTGPTSPGKGSSRYSARTTSPYTSAR